ncbi:MAG: metallophosphoesterase [Bacteroidota bacterium]|nr:metallophosphoesterase [Bacteroidota bacterium]
MRRIYASALSLFIVCFIFAQPVNHKSGGQNQTSNGFTFAFYTDVHLQPEHNAVAGFKQAIDSINSYNPDFVVSGGDQVMDANNQSEKRADSLYSLYLNTAKLIKAPVYNTVGNHELFGTFLKQDNATQLPLYGKKMFEARMGKRFQTFIHKGWKFFILDSNDANQRFKYKGWVDNEQIAWLKSELAATKRSEPIVIVLHIPLVIAANQFDKTFKDSIPEGLSVSNAREVLNLFKGYNLKLVLQGHLHIFNDIKISKTHFITGGAISGWKWTGANRGTEEGFVVIRVKGNSFTTKYIDYGWNVKP